MKYPFLLVIIGLFICTQCDAPKTKISRQKKPIPFINYSYIDNFPHDTNAFTEGFVIYQGALFESTGSPKSLPETQSLFGPVDITTGMIDSKVMLDREKYFGEGITFLNNKIYQLTYESRVGFVYDAKTFEEISRFTIPSAEGWGLTTDSEFIIMSDGTYKLSYLHPENLKVIKQLNVSENGYAVGGLNELEYINGYIFANVWMTNTLVKIDPKNGHVVGKLDLSSIAKESKYLNTKSLEMNGIAYDSISDLIYLTGKMWPKTYRIKINN
jgi:glutamine cyclotransferase